MSDGNGTQSGGDGAPIGPSWPSAVVALGLIALVGTMFGFAAASDNFSTVWAGAGTLVGVLVGAVPSYFFRQSEQKAAGRAQALWNEATHDQRERAMLAAPHAFR